MARKNFQDIDQVANNESIEDYELVATKQGADKRLPSSRLKTDIQEGLDQQINTIVNQKFVQEKQNLPFGIQDYKAYIFLNQATTTIATLENLFRVNNEPLNGGYMVLARVNAPNSTNAPISDRTTWTAIVSYTLNNTPLSISVQNFHHLVMKYKNDVLTAIYTVPNVALSTMLNFLDARIDLIGTPPTVDDFISTDTPNAIVKGTDGKMKVSPSQGGAETPNVLQDTDTIEFTDYANDPLNRNIQPHVIIPNLIEPSDNDAYISGGGKIRVKQYETELTAQGIVELEMRADPIRNHVKLISGNIINPVLLASMLVSQAPNNEIDLTVDGLLYFNTKPSSGGIVEVKVADGSQPRLWARLHGDPLGLAITTVTQNGNIITEITLPTGGKVTDMYAWFDGQSHLSTIAGNSYCLIKLKNFGIAAKKMALTANNAYYKLPDVDIFSVVNSALPTIGSPYSKVTDNMPLHVVEINESLDYVTIALENANQYPQFNVNFYL